MDESRKLAISRDPPVSHITIVDDDEISQFRITIPAQSNWFVIFVLSLCLYGWASLEVVIPTSLIAGLSSGQGKWAGVSGLFLLLIGFPVMTICGLVMVLALCWNLAGREVVTLSLGALGLTREIGVFRRSLSSTSAVLRNSL